MIRTLIVTTGLSGHKMYLRCSIVAHIVPDVFSIRTLGVTTSYHCRCIVDNLKQTFESFSSGLFHSFLIHSSTGSIESIKDISNDLLFTCAPLISLLLRKYGQLSISQHTDISKQPLMYQIIQFKLVFCCFFFFPISNLLILNN